MVEALPAIARMGYTAVQLPPLHPPSTVRFDDKIGSAYAPRDLARISAHIYAGVSPADYLAGNYREADPSEGWVTAREFAEEARSHGLVVMGDLVLAHTAADPDVVRAHEERFGPNFYKGGAVTGASREDGSWDVWQDIRSIDHNGPARAAILAHFVRVVELFMESGITVFRADAAPRIPMDFWRDLIAGAKTFALESGLPVPAFYAEALGTTIDDEVAMITEAGFDGVTTALRWWPRRNYAYDLSAIRDRSAIVRLERVREAGGVGVSFMDNHDLERAVHAFPGMQALITQLALTAFLTSSMTVLAGTESLERRQPTVFLDRLDESRLDASPHDEASHMMRSAMEMIFGIKMGYPIFQGLAYTELIQDGGPLVKIQRTTPAEQVVIVVNVGDEAATYIVPKAFRHGNLFGTMTWPGQRTWFGGQPDTRIRDYRLAPGGLAVFHREIPPTEDVRISGSH
jgi:hypothetical protein